MTRNSLWGNGKDGRKGTGIVLGADCRGERIAGDNVVKIPRPAESDPLAGPAGEPAAGRLDPRLA